MKRILVLVYKSLDIGFELSELVIVLLVLALNILTAHEFKL